MAARAFGKEGHFQFELRLDEAFASDFIGEVSEGIVSLDPSTIESALMVCFGVKFLFTVTSKLLFDNVHSEGSAGNDLELIGLEEEARAHRGRFVGHSMRIALRLVQSSHTHVGVLRELEGFHLEHSSCEISLTGRLSECDIGIDLFFKLIECRVDLSSTARVELNDVISVTVERGGVGR